MINKNPSHPRIIAPPPLIYGFFIALALVLQHFWPMVSLPDLVRYPLGWSLTVAAFALAWFSMAQFRRAGTPVEPWKETRIIVVEGPYRYSRNPIYLAMSLMYLGAGLILSNMWIFLFLVPLIFMMQFGVIAREEKYLEKKFGGEYLNYKSSVRRWI